MAEPAPDMLTAILDGAEAFEGERQMVQDEDALQRMLDTGWENFCLMNNIWGDVRYPALRKLRTGVFAGCQCLEEVSLPPRIEKIEANAFGGCRALKRIDMPEHLKVVAPKAFTSLMSLEAVEFSTNLVMIGQGAFTGCQSLKSAKLPSSVIAVVDAYVKYPNMSVSAETFYSNLYTYAESSLSKVQRQQLHYPVGLFANCRALESVELDGMWYTSIPPSMFYNCSALTNIVFPGKTLTLNAYALRGCTALEEIQCSSGMNSLMPFALTNCPSLKRIVLSEKMRSIPANAFKNMVSLEEISVSSNLVSIGASAFESCTSLRKINMPDTVTVVGNRAFYGCTSLAMIHLSSNAKHFSRDVFEPDSRVWVDIDPAVRKTELFGNGKVRVLSAVMSESDPGKMIVSYEVVSSNAVVHAYPVVFVGGGRSFANVMLPRTLENASTEIPANEVRTLVWDVGADLGVDFSGTLRFGFVSDAGKEGAGSLLDGLFWQYAQDSAGLLLSHGELCQGETVLANGAAPTSAAAGYLADESVDSSAIIHGESKSVQVRLVTHRFVKDMVIDGVLNRFFTVPGIAGGVVFDGAVMPIAADVNGDGLFDMVVATPGNTNVYLNVGTASSPEFRTASSALAVGITVAPAALAEYPAVAAALRNGSVSTEGLNVAIVDWNGDGGTDALCGTADGRILMLSDQSVGRPSGFRGEFSPTSVNLSWDPIYVSSVRGYRVYRSEGKDGEMTCLEEPLTALPRFTDSPSSLGVDYWYRVSAVSRRYVAGNSEPEYVESKMSDPIYGMFGMVELLVPDVTVSTNGVAEVTFSIRNTMDLSGNGGSFTISYDPAVLTPLKVNTVGTTGLSSAFQVKVKEIDDELGELTVTTQGGKCPAGGGAFLRLCFDVASVSAATTTVAVAEASMKVAGNATAEVSIMPTSGRVIILPPAYEASQGGVPPYSRGDMNGDGVLDVADIRLLARLKDASGRKYTSEQLRAGDFNGNGKLDNADFQALKALLKAKGVL